MSASRTTFYLDKYVCAGIADYTGIEVMWVRIASVLLMITGIGIPWIPIAYMLIAWMAPKKPIDLYPSEADAKFWQGVRSNPKRSTTEVRSKFRDIDRRLADIETFYTSRNTMLASEIDSLR
jgi:phage shock protein C